MTAEVAILNKSGIAVAADSAVTRGRNKVHISANKIFQLHKTMPVGIVVYNFADIFGLPWELIAKTYREQAPEQGFRTLKEFCDDFLTFLQRPVFLTEGAKEHDILQLGVYLFGRLSSSKEKVGTPRRNRLLRAEMEKFLSRKKVALGSFSSDYSLHKFRRNRTSLCKAICDEAVAGFKVSASNQTLFTQCVYDLATHSGRSDYHSGFAIFGYGAQELLPSLWHCVVDGAPLDALRILGRDESRVERLPPDNARILAFAQSDAAALFMEGVSPDLKRFFLRAMGRSLDGFSKRICEEVRPIVSDVDAIMISENILKREISKFMSSFQKQVAEHIQRDYVNPVVTSIDGLGKDDMANLAESIVELASLKKKVSNEVETVGGPIDVAVVSKNDGFVWIKRKYYFNIELNKAFYHRYYDRRFELESDP